MEYRTLRNGQKISTIGIGVGNYGYESVSAEEIKRIFETAFEQGVNFFDTCMSVSWPAKVIAETIKGKRDQLVMQNHLCVAYPEGEYQHLLKLSEIKDAFGKELKKYGTDYSDIGTIHFVDEDYDLQRLIDTGVIDYAFELKKQGVIRNVAFSSHTPSVAKKALDAADFDAMFFGVNAGYDYEPSDDGLVLSEERTELYRECSKRGISITVMKVYNNGQLLDARLSPFGRTMTPAQCLQYALDRPAVVSCLAGAVTSEEMKETLRFYETSQAERDYSFIGALQKKDMAGVCTYCGHCMPCPQKIEINAVSRYFDLVKAGDPMAIHHYRNLEVQADACVECGHCKEFCPFHVNMPKRMKDIAKFFSAK
ncbi:aldo/keto reductase [Porcipelethomonas ammoniilytica]|uniref:aldo/keto reductase n=1 Tax=Porcipelethomonas ammoniilytica TaxID=2981722 RepID=UPI00082331B5|nr:aldo/keto reductase [Porcipelethomonas ammoniilytica]MCU6718607.1 aldo/keto reductase [Porcipelethomonas ammoniilytica]SCI54400.1 Aldo/keto reductase family [uncultured Ruminococcus sp.]